MGKSNFLLFGWSEKRENKMRWTKFSIRTHYFFSLPNWREKRRKKINGKESRKLSLRLYLVGYVAQKSIVVHKATHFCVTFFPSSFLPNLGRKILIALGRKHPNSINFPSKNPPMTQPNTLINFFSSPFFFILPKINQTKRSLIFHPSTFNNKNKIVIHPKIRHNSALCLSFNFSIISTTVKNINIFYT